MKRSRSGSKSRSRGRSNEQEQEQAPGTGGVGKKTELGRIFGLQVVIRIVFSREEDTKHEFCEKL
eukprot:764746-Hanusia_phi.AAC.5